LTATLGQAHAEGTASIGRGIFGEVVTGRTSDDLSMEYSALAAMVNLGARAIPR